MNLPHSREVTVVAGSQYTIAFNLDAVEGFDWSGVTWVCKVRDVADNSLLASPTVVSVSDTDGSASVVTVFEGSDTALMPPTVRMEIAGRMVAPVWGPHVMIRRDINFEPATFSFA